MKRLIYISSLLIFSFLIYCSSGTGPDDKSPRSYEWTVDTLDNFGAYQSEMRSVWGTSPDNVYTSGYSSGSYEGCMFHFDGKSWNTVLDVDDGGGDLIGEMLGFADDNIWVCGNQAYYDTYPETISKCFLFHFTGVEWEKVYPPFEGWLECLGGEYPDNFWAGGYNVLLKYDNGQWLEQSLQFPGAREGEMFIRDIAGNSEQGLYLTLEVREPSDISYYYLYRLEGDRWQLVLGGDTYPRLGRLWMSPAGILYLSNPGGYKLVNNTLEELSISTGIHTYSIYGTSEKNIFLTGQDSGITKFYHYNGSDWHEYRELSSELIRSSRIWAGGNEVFFVCITYEMRTVVYHGK